MELDDLKSIWKKNETGFQPKDEAEIAAMLKGNSQSIVDKLKRSVWFELILTIVAGVALLVYALTLPPGTLKWTSVSILVILVAYSVYYIKKLMLLNRFHPGDENLRAGIEHLVSNLTSYLKFYKRSYTILYPVYFVLGLVYAAIDQGEKEFFESFTKPSSIGILVLIASGFYFCSTWLVDWFLKKLYGNHLEKLKGILHELRAQV
jgi:glucan phosphoethanolaminetransferase (alkaline phosphatase superfamily)